MQEERWTRVNIAVEYGELTQVLLANFTEPLSPQLNESTVNNNIYFEGNSDRHYPHPDGRSHSIGSHKAAGVPSAVEFALAVTAVCHPIL